VSETLELLAAYDPLAARPAPPRAGRSARYILLDVFTDIRLQGNQLAVFPDARGIPAEQMQPLARELKLSESVFVLPPEHGTDVAIRIFTPSAELPFAGHPVLGSAIVVAGALGIDQVTLQTGSGPVQVRVRRERGLVCSGWMRQPIPSWAPFEHRRELLGALGVERSELPVEAYDNGPTHVYVALESEAAVAELAPELGALARLGSIGVSCFAGVGAGWKTRSFAPGLGVAEDPATGSAAGPLAVHLCRHGRIPFGTEIEIRQGAEIDRPSLLRARVVGSDARIERVEVGGAAVIAGRGELLLG
jgi:trans-2,3-dihydro-3-hydroxyanthranilate isomerase